MAKKNFLTDACSCVRDQILLYPSPVNLLRDFSSASRPRSSILLHLLAGIIIVIITTARTCTSSTQRFLDLTKPTLPPTAADYQLQPRHQTAYFSYSKSINPKSTQERQHRIHPDIERDPRFWPGGMGRGSGMGMGGGMRWGMGGGIGMGRGMGIPNMQQPFHPPQGFQNPNSLLHQQQQQPPEPPAASSPPPKDSRYPRFVNPFKDEKPKGFYGKREYVPGQEAIRIPFGHRGDDPWVSWHMMQARRQLQGGRRNW